MKRWFGYIAGFCCVVMAVKSTAQIPVGAADKGNGFYQNPVLHADYSDPDAIRVGNQYYMTASSFTHIPGLPLLQSSDMVNWKLVGHALPRLQPIEHYSKVQHGAGVWAPSIRFHKGEFYIYFPDPDFGIYVIKARNFQGPWSQPVLVEAGKGLIDPCPLWDDDGKVYLAHAFAGSRAGIKSVLVVKEMNAAGTKTIGSGVMVFDGHPQDPTVEGPKLYKRNGYYYIFAPAGGVSTGWQLVLRSKNIYGPYERKVVMDQGKSSINGPHQGAWVTAADGKDWFLHFQDKEAYGRIVHLQPMVWKNDWPVIGADADNDGIGEPVKQFKKPVASAGIQAPPTSDEFNTALLGKQWQWQANPNITWAFPTTQGYLRMFAVYRADSLTNAWDYPNLLAQKFPAESFTATVKLRFAATKNNEQAGFMVHGADYAFLGLTQKDGITSIQYHERLNADKNKPEKITALGTVEGQDIFLRLVVAPGAKCRFAFSADGKTFTEAPHVFTAKPGRWVGAKFGFFINRNTVTNDGGYIDIDWIRIQALQ
ncbi:glycoside hydrolase family 43 protein [Phnomibacter ginsenosidimutans]|uniref:Family 43 glycosylhydrolase n=1 Tax=Phnomibacter ginsenosidimutans TaxID=2676868 RepID=A0A6I6G632_9BACT|nr:glycoside hydrolase 43 family protein [Phnomibacter ginsenosidimutans]QGW28116.1 family 43 glycosylhydrolase [Phnomibacter ginsenosidimutans]